MSWKDHERLCENCGIKYTLRPPVVTDCPLCNAQTEIRILKNELQAVKEQIENG